MAAVRPLWRKYRQHRRIVRYVVLVFSGGAWYDDNNADSCFVPELRCPCLQWLPRCQNHAELDGISMKKGYLFIAVAVVMFSTYEVAVKFIAGQINSMQLTL